MGGRDTTVLNVIPRTPSKSLPSFPHSNTQCPLGQGEHSLSKVLYHKVKSLQLSGNSCKVVAPKQTQLL